MIFVGIDPGKYGAVAALNSNGKVLGVWDTPCIKVKRSGKKHNDYVPAKMAALLKENSEQWRKGVTVAIERVGARPGQGVTSMFSMGCGFGLWLGICAALSLPVELVMPNVWKKAFRLGSDKAESIVRAAQLVPSSAPYLTLKKHDGRAEAILIAEYLHRSLAAAPGAAPDL